MSRQYLIQQHGGWLVFDNGRVSRSETRPRPQRSALAITDTEGSVSSVASLEGSPAHAVALIEKRLRADGLIDNDSKILIHKVHTVGAGYQALFTAVPLDLWQQTFAWAEAQPDHCLLVPATALLWSKLGVGQVLVCQSGRQLTVLARAQRPTDTDDAPLEVHVPDTQRCRLPRAHPGVDERDQKATVDPQ